MQQQAFKAPAKSRAIAELGNEAHAFATLRRFWRGQKHLPIIYVSNYLIGA